MAVIKTLRKIVFKFLSPSPINFNTKAVIKTDYNTSCWNSNGLINGLITCMHIFLSSVCCESITTRH